MSHQYQSLQDDSIPGHEAQADLASLLGLPLEIREKIYSYILPTGTCLRIDQTSGQFGASPSVPLHPIGSAIHLESCRFNQRCNTSAHRLLRECVYWDGTCPVETSLLFTSRALQAEVIAFLFRENTLALAHDTVHEELDSYLAILGPWMKDVRSVVVRESVSRTHKQVNPVRVDDFMGLTTALTNMTSILVCVTVCSIPMGDHPHFSESHVLELFRAWGRCGLGPGQVELSQCAYHELRDVKEGYIRALELKCREQMEIARSS